MPRDHFHYKRKRYEVIDRVTLGRKEFLISSQLSAGIRRRYLAFDQIGGPHGELRILQFLPNTRETWKRVRVLQEIAKRSPELPQIIEFHRCNNEIIIVQPWIEGNDLAWWIERLRRKERQRIGTPEALRLFRGLAHALRRIHREANSVHADIKPANIIVSPNSRRLMLIDYGSAWQVEETISRVEGDGQSEHYAAPEIVAGLKRVDFRADYFSLAAVCFEVITLELPYSGLGGNAGSFAAANDPESLYMPPSKLSRESEKLPRSTWKSIDTFFEQALKLNADGRFDKPHEWLEEWDQLAILARRPPQLSFINQWIVKCLGWMSRSQQK
ncbi:MAG: hypothetical protein KDA89_03145 [Planctomycetaceae bacterium]|nr:hypothetical protein [Planctomycetaceae bacterium]MCA9047695.1 hypothetical protein [Planctomycetaceae bacterium]